MMTATKPLLSLTAADLMSPTVLTIPEHMSLKGAAHLLSQAGVSGAPVVDSTGHCIGVLSAYDFLTWAGQSAPALRGPARADCFCSAWQLMTGEQLPNESVREHMTADPVTASPGTRVGDLAGMMIDAHIHRVVIVDRTGQPVGVVSSTDVLAAVARAAHAGDQ
jgi:CBS domain-containing protein